MLSCPAHTSARQNWPQRGTKNSKTERDGRTRILSSLRLLRPIFAAEIRGLRTQELKPSDMNHGLHGLHGASVSTWLHDLSLQGGPVAWNVTIHSDVAVPGAVLDQRAYRIWVDIKSDLFIPSSCAGLCCILPTARRLCISPRSPRQQRRTPFFRLLLSHDYTLW